MSNRYGVHVTCPIAVKIRANDVSHAGCLAVRRNQSGGGRMHLSAELSNLGGSDETEVLGVLLDDVTDKDRLATVQAMGVANVRLAATEKTLSYGDLLYPTLEGNVIVATSVETTHPAFAFVYESTKPGFLLAQMLMPGGHASKTTSTSFADAAASFSEAPHPQHAVAAAMVDVARERRAPVSFSGHIVRANDDATAQGCLGAFVDGDGRLDAEMGSPAHEVLHGPAAGVAAAPFAEFTAA